jgi:hypothetical protein
MERSDNNCQIHWGGGAAGGQVDAEGLIRSAIRPPLRYGGQSESPHEWGNLL